MTDRNKLEWICPVCHEDQIADYLWSRHLLVDHSSNPQDVKIMLGKIDNGLVKPDGEIIMKTILQAAQQIKR